MLTQWTEDNAEKIKKIMTLKLMSQFSLDIYMKLHVSLCRLA